MGSRVIGAGIGAQFIGGNPNHYEWRVRYELDGGDVRFHNVSSFQARSSMEAIEVAKRELRTDD